MTRKGKPGAPFSVLLFAAVSSRKLLGRNQYRKGFLTVLLAFVNALLDVFSAACLLPVLFILLTPHAVERNIYLHRLYSWTGFRDSGNFLLALVLLLFILFLGRSIIATMIHRFQANYVFGVSADLSEKMYARYFRQSYLEFTGGHSATTARQIVNIPNDYAQHVLLSLINIINETLVILFIIAALAVYQPLLMLPVVLVTLPLLFVAFSFRNRKLGNISSRMKHLYDLNLKQLMMGIDGFVELKLNRKQDYYVKRFNENNKLLAADHAFLSAVQSSSAKLLELIAVSGLCLLLLLFVLLAGTSETTVLGLSIFAVALFKILPSVNRIFSGYVQIKTYSYTLASLNHSPDYPEATGAPHTFREYIELKNIGFTYPGRSAPCLKNVDLVICRGEIIGIAGRSGAGKTTLIHILAGLLDGYQGKILIDGEKLRKEDIPQWQQSVAYVPQSPVIFDVGFAENIAVGETREEMDWIRLQNAVDKVQLGVLQESLSAPWQQTAGENGVRFSGGQKQRIAIARALYSNASVLLLDEPFSNLDRRTEEDMLTILNGLAAEGKTIVIISHHARSLSLCDERYELNGGRLYKTTHSNLPG